MNGLTIKNGKLTQYQGQDEIVVISDNVTSIGKNSFKGNKYVKKVVLPEGITAIYDYAFQGCENLEELNLPTTLQTIGDGAFQNCEKLTTLCLPDSVTSIGDFAFYKCASPHDENGFIIAKNIIYGYYGTKTEIEIPSGVTEIAQQAF